MPTTRPAPTMTEPPGASAFAALYETRHFDPNWRPPDMANAYCPRCNCNKSGRAGEPNPTTEACSWPGHLDGDGLETGCLCHDETLAFAESLP